MYARTHTHAHPHTHTHTHTHACPLTHSLTRPKGEKSVWRSSALTAGTSPLTHKLHCGGLQNKTGRTILQQSNVSQSNVVLQSCAEKTFSGLPTLLNLSYPLFVCGETSEVPDFSLPQINPTTWFPTGERVPTKLIQESDKVIQIALERRSFA